MDTDHRSVKILGVYPKRQIKNTDLMLHELMLPEEFERCIGNDIRTLSGRPRTNTDVIRD